MLARRWEARADREPGKVVGAMPAIASLTGGMEGGREGEKGREPKEVISVFMAVHVDLCHVWSYKGQRFQLVDAAHTLSLPLYCCKPGTVV